MITIQDVLDAWADRPASACWDLPLLGGCECCEESLSTHNMYPSKSGFVRCRRHIGQNGYKTVAEFETACQSEDAALDQKRLDDDENRLMGEQNDERE